MRKPIIFVFILAGSLVLSGCSFLFWQKQKHDATELNSSARSNMSVTQSLFDAQTLGFTFMYPSDWTPALDLNNSNFKSGVFTKNNESIVHFEAAYIAHSFLAYFKDGVPYFLASPLYGVAPRQMYLESTKRLPVNNSDTTIVLQVLRPCSSQRTDIQQNCVPTSTGGIELAYFEPHSTEPSLAISDNHDVVVFYVDLPNDLSNSNANAALLEQLLSTVKITSVVSSSPIEAVSMPTSTEDANPVALPYENKKYAYSLLYPSKLALQENADLADFSLNPGTVFVFPDSLYTGTNLQNAKIVISTVAPDAVENECLVPDGNIDDGAELFNTENFVRSKGSTGVGGTTKENITYGVLRGDWCYHITLSFSALPMTDVSESVKQYDQAPFVSTLDAIMQSFKFSEN